MKRIILLAVLQFTCLLASAQHIAEIDSIRRCLRFTSDKLTGRLTATIKDTLSGSTGNGYPFMMVARYNTKDNYFAISVLCKNTGCVRNRAVVDFIFTDGKKKTAWNYDGDNCDGYFMMLYKSWIGIEPREISAFTTNSVNTIRLNGSETVEIVLTKQQADLFKSQMKWLKYYADNWKKVDKLNGYD